jgi:2,3-diketo-5-methylthio-1-phosphopentane phosphatase
MKKIFLIDFDKTISFKDSTDTLMEAHNYELLMDYQRLFRAKKLRVREYLKGLLESLNMDEATYMDEVSKNLPLDPHFKEFVGLGHDFRIVSAGTYFNIIPNLKKEGILVPREHIYSNDIAFKSDGSLEVFFPHENGDSRDGICKRTVVEKYKKIYDQVIFIGDGVSDFDCADVADFVFAKVGLRLANYCEENNIPYIPYESFKDINKYILTNKI